MSGKPDIVGKWPLRRLKDSAEPEIPLGSLFLSRKLTNRMLVLTTGNWNHLPKIRGAVENF